ncbi:unnamed protein product [Linum trigynum]|uniref:Uncharacterized protein n=1 Tax=Linum trigynum TaxID=586398 RepID=A0AAV2FSK9_9ROSI
MTEGVAKPHKVIPGVVTFHDIREYQNILVEENLLSQLEFDKEEAMKLPEEDKLQKTVLHLRFQSEAEGQKNLQIEGEIHELKVKSQID